MISQHQKQQGNARNAQNVNKDAKKSKKQVEQEAEIRSHVKELLMEFFTFTKAELLWVLEFCDYSLEVSQIYLRTNSKAKIKKNIREILSGKIDSLEGVQVPQASPSKEEKKEEAKVEEWVPTGPNFIDLKITDELVHHILDFLDPISLGTAGFVYKRFYNVSQHPLLFKKFCRKLYSQLPPLPANSPFNVLLIRINSAPRGEYDRKFITQANQDIRSIVWKPNVKHFYTPTDFYKKYANMRDIYMNAPRVKFGGVYMLKERYIRAGTKDLTGFYDPYHTIEFYRYFRFFPDGLVMSSLAVNKIKKEKLMKVFKLERDWEDEDHDNFNTHSGIKNVLQGEYIIQKQFVHCRLNVKTTFYEYQLEINSSAPGLFDQLRMMDQSMRIIDSYASEPLQNDYMGSKMFKFVKVPQMLEELGDHVKGYAL